ncbi:hypothetical protein ACQQ2N_20440 [Dokdonella sp. MW10]|uniref:hypothetical protein n=1 Tax=Dokdonella sp. MW10 TaxID=2992926 RepID=UPI003F7E5B5D
MKKHYDPPLTTNPNDPLFRVDKGIASAQKKLDVAIDMKRHHTRHNLAQEVIKEAREMLRKAEHARALKLKELAVKAAEMRAAGK